MALNIAILHYRHALKSAVFGMAEYAMIWDVIEAKRAS